MTFYELLKVNKFAAYSFELPVCFMTNLLLDGQYFPVDCNEPWCDAYVCEYKKKEDDILTKNVTLHNPVK